MHTNLLTPDNPNLRHLPPEPWGNKVRRARKGSLRTQASAARIIERATGRTMSDATLSRLESREEAPTDRSMRRNAYMFALVFGFDPFDLDLTRDDAPDDEVVARLVDIAVSTRRATGRYRDRRSMMGRTIRAPVLHGPAVMSART